MIERSHNKIRVLAAESFELVRMGLRALFKNHSSMHLVAETNSIEGLFKLTMQHNPDVILIDLLLSGDNYAEHISKLLHISPQSKILAFSQHDSNKHTYLQTFHPGAAHIISKHQSSKLLLKAIYAIHMGKTMFDHPITKLAQQVRFTPNSSAEIQTEDRTSPQVKLSNCERRIAYLACKGLSAKEISLQLILTEKTVRNNLSAVYKKIGVKKQIELCLKAPFYNNFK
jgi:DNA-binding NarL/FixJ family response regulator